MKLLTARPHLCRVTPEKFADALKRPSVSGDIEIVAVPKARWPGADS